MKPTEFRARLSELFSEDDLRDLCFELRIEFEELPGETKSAITRELFIYCHRRGLLEELRAACAAARPHVEWPPLAIAPGTAATSAAPEPTTAPTATVDPTALMRGVQEALAALHAKGGATPLVPDELTWHFPIFLRALVEGRLVPFLGSEVNLSGRPAGEPWQPSGAFAPSAEEIAAHLAASFPNPGEARARLTQVTQFVSVMAGAGTLRNELRRLLAVDYTPTPLHAFFAALPGLLRDRGYASPHLLLVSTSPDDLLERAFDAAGEPYDRVAYIAEGEWRGRFLHSPPGEGARVVERPNEYRALLDGPRTVILKLYGAVDRADPARDSFVVTEDHYIDYVAGSDFGTLLPVPLADRLRNSHLLFLGYRQSDWPQRVILHRLWGVQPFAFPSWAVHAMPSPFEEKGWSARNVDVLDVSLDGYLERLSAQLLALPPMSRAP